MLEMLQFIFMGLCGGFTFVLMKAEGWTDLKQFKMVRRILIGAVVGFLYFFLYSEHNFPNMVMSFVSGYMGTDFIESLIKKARKKNSHR